MDEPGKTLEALRATGWGMRGNVPPCEHLLALVERMLELGIRIWSTHGVQPDGWVNVDCDQCSIIYEITLREPWEIE